MTYSLRFREICHSHSPVEALKFLRSHVAEVVDHTSAETDTFQKLLSHLLTKPSNTVEPMVVDSSPSDPTDRDTEVKATSEALDGRTRVFEALLSFYPTEAKEPASNLVDMIDWYEESNHD